MWLAGLTLKLSMPCRPDVLGIPVRIKEVVLNLERHSEYINVLCLKHLSVVAMDVMASEMLDFRNNVKRDDLFTRFIAPE